MTDEEEEEIEEQALDEDDDDDDDDYEDLSEDEVEFIDDFGRERDDVIHEIIRENFDEFFLDQEPELDDADI